MEKQVSSNLLMPLKRGSMFFPKIKVISREDWLSKPTQPDDMRLFLGWDVGKMMAFYHPFTRTIFVREDCYTYGIIIHELGHWILHCLGLRKKLTNWWEERYWFPYRTILVAMKAGILSKEEVNQVRELISTERRNV